MRAGIPIAALRFGNGHTAADVKTACGVKKLGIDLAAMRSLVQRQPVVAAADTRPRRFRTARAAC